MEIFSDIKPTCKLPNSLQNGEIKTRNTDYSGYKPDIADFISSKVVNKRDIEDTVTMPRAIFKGYMCFTAGTAISAITTGLKQNKFTKGLNIAGSVLSIFGTYNFVKPFLIKQENSNKEK